MPKKSYKLLRCRLCDEDIKGTSRYNDKSIIKYNYQGIAEAINNNTFSISDHHDGIAHKSRLVIYSFLPKSLPMDIRINIAQYYNPSNLNKWFFREYYNAVIYSFKLFKNKVVSRFAKKEKEYIKQLLIAKDAGFII